MVTKVTDVITNVQVTVTHSSVTRTQGTVTVHLAFMDKTVTRIVLPTVLARPVIRRMLNVHMDVWPDTINHTVMSLALVNVKMGNVTGMMGSVLVNVPWDIMGRLVMNNVRTTVLKMCA